MTWVIAGLCAAVGFSARADEPLFGYVNTTDLLPRDKVQIEQWATWRDSDGPGRFHRLEGRTEVDYGLTSDLQVTAYLNYSRQSARLDAAAARTAGAAGSVDIHSGRLDGVTAEAIWRVASPYLAPVGAALLADYSFGPDQPVFGVKGIVQKNLLDDTLVLAANLRLDVGQRESLPAQAGRPAAWRHVTRLEADLGASYRFRPNWSAALELRARDRYAGGAWRDTAIYAGPTLHYGAQRWFMTLSALGRLHGAHRANRPGDAAGALSYLAERTRADGVRFRIGRTF